MSTPCPEGPEEVSPPTIEELLEDVALTIAAARVEGEAPTRLYLGLRQIATLYQHLRSLGLCDPPMPRRLHGLTLVLLPDTPDRCEVGETPI